MYVCTSISMRTKYLLRVLSSLTPVYRTVQEYPTPAVDPQSNLRDPFNFALSQHQPTPISMSKQNKQMQPPAASLSTQPPHSSTQPLPTQFSHYGQQNLLTTNHSLSMYSYSHNQPLSQPPTLPPTGDGSIESCLMPTSEEDTEYDPPDESDSDLFVGGSPGPATLRDDDDEKSQFSSFESCLMPKPEVDTVYNRTERSNFDLIVEGIPAKLRDDDDEKSLKSLLEQWTSSSPEGVVATYGDNVSDITRVGNSARCMIHTTHQSTSMFCFRFLVRISSTL